MSIGIYAIYRRSDNGCMYVGQSKEVETRINSHLSNNTNTDFNRDNYYGKVIEVFDFYDKENQLNREAYWINELNPELNIIRNRVQPESFRDSMRGDNNPSRREDVRKKISESQKGNKRKQSSIEKQRKTMTGRHLSEEHIRHIVEARRGYKHSEETKQKIREKRKLQVFTEESRKKMSEARKGKKRPEEFKQKMRGRHRIYREDGTWYMSK